MALDENVSSLIGRIYESVDASDRWDAVVEEMRKLLNARCILQTVADLNHSDMLRTTTYGEPRVPSGEFEYREELYALDPTFGWAVEHPFARFCDVEDVIPADDHLNHQFIRWARDKWIGSTHWLVGYTAPEDELTFGLSVHPSAEAGPLAPHQKALFKMLFEHMERAIRLQAHPPLLSSGDEALILLDRLGHIRETSPAAFELLERGDGLTVWDNQLHAADSNSSGRLNAAILSALNALRDGSFGGAVALPRPSGKRDLLVTVIPLVNPPSPFDAFRPAALVRIVDPELGVAHAAAARWSQLFDFSPAETRFAEKLMSRDQNLRHAADEVGVTYATARVHLKKLLEKTGTHSQSQLARLLTRVE